MFVYQRRVFLKDVDETGAIYFTALFSYAQEAFEVFLHQNNTSLKDFFSKGYLFPVVHAEADYTSFLGLSDEVDLSLSIKAIGQRSITVVTEVKNRSNGKIAGKVTLVHAFLLKGESNASKVPEEIISFLKVILKN